MATKPLVLIRGGGDLATGVGVRLHRCGFNVVVTEIEQPLAVRRLVALAEAVYAGEVTIEDVRGVRVDRVQSVQDTLDEGVIPVLIDPELESRHLLELHALVDGRMHKAPPELGIEAAPFVIGLGPGFLVGRDCHAVVETNRGHAMGRVLWQGMAERDTAIPEAVQSVDVDRVLRAPSDGIFRAVLPLASPVRQGELIATIGGVSLEAPFDGVLRGLLHDGLEVKTGMKVGDLDPRGVAEYCRMISDKSLAVGGGVLEALLSRAEIRSQLGS